MPPPPANPSRRRALLAVGLVAAVTHGAVCLLPVGTPPDQLSNDEREYVQLAESLAERGEFRLPDGTAAKRMPAFPALLAVLRRTQPADTWLGGAYVVQSMLAWAGTLLTAAIASRVGGARAAIFAGVVAAVYAPTLYLEHLLLSEPLAMVLLLTAVYLCCGSAIATTVYVPPAQVSRSPDSGLAAEQPLPPPRERTRLAAAGLALGMAVLARANLLLAVPALTTFVLLLPGPPMWRLRRAALVTVLALLPPALWCVRNHAAVGRFTLSTIGGLNFYLGHNPGFAGNPGLSSADYDAFDRLRAVPGLGEVAADRELYARGWAFVREQPVTATANIARKTVVWLTPTTRSFGPILLCMTFGMLAWHAAAVAREGGGRRRFVIMSLACVVPALVVLGNLFAPAPDGGRDSVLLPLASERDLLLVGLPALFLSRFDSPVRKLLLAVFLSQWLVAVAFIPLSRVRWVVDPLLMVALAVAIEHIGARWRAETESTGDIGPQAPVSRPAG